MQTSHHHQIAHQFLFQKAAATITAAKDSEL